MPFLGGRGQLGRGFFGAGTVPDAPTGLSSTRGDAQLFIAFTAPLFTGGLPITNYEYALSTNGGSTYGPWGAITPPDNTAPVTISGLVNGTTYSVKLRAVNNLGPGAESSAVSINTKPFTTPSAPSISAARQASQTIRLTVALPSNGSISAPYTGGSPITKYFYRYKTTGGYGSWVDSGVTVSTTGPTYIDVSGLSNGTSYTFQVYAVNAAGNSTESNESSAVPYTTPSAPTISAARTASQQITLTISSAPNGGSAITTFYYRYKTTGGYTAWINTNSTSTSIPVGSLSNGTSYTFQVYGENAAGAGAASNESSAIPYTIPDKVGTPSSSAGDKSFTISWSAPGDGGESIDGYRVQISSNGGANWAYETTTTGTSYTWNPPTWTMSNGTSYVGRVQAYNAAGDGAYSDASTARTATFAAPSLTGAGSYASLDYPNTRKVEWTVNPTDIYGSNADAGTTTYVYLQWMYTDDTWSNARTSEELVATYSGNQSRSGSGTSFTNSGVVLAGEQYRIRAEQTDGVHTVGTGWVNIQIIATQNSPYNAWAYTNGVEIYTTGPFNVNGGSFFQVSTREIGGVNTENVGDTQYTMTLLRITATGSSGSSASTATRYFTVQHSGTSKTLPPVAQTSSISNTWTGAGNNSTTYDWNINNIPYGNAGAGKVAVDGGGVSSWSPSITVVIEGRGNKRVMTTYNRFY